MLLIERLRRDLSHKRLEKSIFNSNNKPLVLRGVVNSRRLFLVLSRSSLLELIHSYEASRLHLLASHHLCIVRAVAQERQNNAKTYLPDQVSML